jgi:PAS domain S-box-containing protein
MDTAKQYRNRLNSLLEGIQIIDFDWRYVYLNNIAAAQSKIQVSELLGFTMMEKYPGIENTPLFEMLELTMKDRQTRRVENEFTFPDGSVRWFDLRIQPAEEGICILSLDITNHKLSEEKIQRGKNLYSFLSHINQGIVHLTDEQSLFKTACDAAIEFGKFKIAWFGTFDEKYETINLIAECGIPADQLEVFSNAKLSVGGPQRHVINTGTYFAHSDLQQSESDTLKNFAVAFGIHSFVVLPIRKGGKITGTFNLYSEKTGFTENDEILLLEEVVTDISFALNNFERERKHRETEQILIENEKRFRALTEKGADMKTMATADGKLFYGSPSINKMLGYDTENMMHASLFDLIHPDDIPEFARKRAELVNLPGESIEFQARMRHADGRWIWCEGIATNLLEESGVHAIVSNFRDITEKKKVELALESQNKALIKTNFELDRFVYSVSHDLRSPLTSILGLLSFIEEESKEPDTLQHAAMIRSGINRLDGFIKNILTYSRNNRTEIEAVQIPLQETVLQIISALRNIKNAGNIDFSVDIDQSVPFYSDLQGFHTIVENMISNAIKFQKKEATQNFIKISGTTHPDFLDLTIADNGIGIPLAQQDKIFDMFFRAAAHIDGSGIGLYIVKEIVGKLEGSITVESEPDKGTTFHIRLKNLKP